MIHSVRDVRFFLQERRFLRKLFTRFFFYTKGLSGATEFSAFLLDPRESIRISSRLRYVLSKDGFRDLLLLVEPHEDGTSEKRVDKDGDLVIKSIAPHWRAGKC